MPNISCQISAIVCSTRLDGATYMFVRSGRGWSADFAGSFIAGSDSGDTHCAILACKSPVEIMTREGVDGESRCANTETPSSGVMPNSAKLLTSGGPCWSPSLKRQKSQSTLIHGTGLIWRIRSANASTKAFVAVTEKSPKPPSTEEIVDVNRQKSSRLPRKTFSKTNNPRAFGRK